MATPRLYSKGDWKAVCDVCGREYLASTLRQRWDGFMTCQQDWEPRHPQEFVRGVADVQSPKWTRPESTDTYVFIPINSATAGIAITGLAVASRGFPIGLIPPSTFTD